LKAAKTRAKANRAMPGASSAATPSSRSSTPRARNQPQLRCGRISPAAAFRSGAALSAPAAMFIVSLRSMTFTPFARGPPGRGCRTVLGRACPSALLGLFVLAALLGGGLLHRRGLAVVLRLDLLAFPGALAAAARDASAAGLLALRQRDGQRAGRGVGGAGILVDVARQRDAPLEGAVAALRIAALLVGAAVLLLAAQSEDAVLDGQVDVLFLDARQLGGDL